MTTAKTTRWDVGGSTFNAPKPDPAQINGHCQASLLRASGGRILFANPHTAHGRCNGTVLLSTDPSAKTWTREIPLGSSAVEAFAYSCLTHLPADNDSVGLIFETADPPGCAGVSCQLRFRTVSLKNDDGGVHSNSDSRAGATPTIGTPSKPVVLFPPGASAPNSSYPGGYKVFRIPAIIAHPRPEGRLVLAFAEGRQFGCECSTTPTDICSKDLVLRRSHDGGATFEAMQVAVSAAAIPGGDKRDGLWNPSPAFDRVSGKLLLLFNRSPCTLAMLCRFAAMPVSLTSKASLLHCRAAQHGA